MYTAYASLLTHRHGRKNLDRVLDLLFRLNGLEKGHVRPALPCSYQLGCQLVSDLPNSQRLTLSRAASYPSTAIASVRAMMTMSDPP